MSPKPTKLMTEYLYQMRMVFKNGPFFGQNWFLFKSGPPTQNSLKAALVTSGTIVFIVKWGTMVIKDTLGTIVNEVTLEMIVM